MTLLDEQEKQLLEQARREFTPDRQQADKVLAAVLTSIPVAHHSALTESLVGGSKATVAAGTASSGPLATAASSTVGVASAKAWLVGTVIALGTGAGLWALGDASNSTPQPGEATSSAAPKPTPLVASPTAIKALPTGTAPIASASQDRLAPQPAEPTRAFAPTAATKVVPHQLDLRSELARIREAEIALNAGNPAQALAVIDKLGRTAQGTLGEEREALRVLAHCQLRTPSSRERAARFLNTYRSSIYALRVRGACGD